jgi:exosortase
MADHPAAGRQGLFEKQPANFRVNPPMNLPAASPGIRAEVDGASVASQSLMRRQVVAMLPVGLALVWLMFFLTYAAGYGTYRRTLFDWMCGYWNDATWQHGALAFPMAVFLTWRRRRTLSRMPAAPSFAGLALAAFSLAMYWAGYRASFFMLGFASVQLLIAAAVLWIWGWRHFWTVSFAWLVLGFAWPYFFLEDTLSFQLRWLMVKSTSWLLNHAGIATVQDGTRLLSAAVQGRAQGQWFELNVDAPCSGLRSLFALMMVGTLFSYFRQRSLWRRVLLVLLAVPLAILANMARIIILVLAAIVFGQGFAVGEGEGYTSNFHFFAGILVFLIAFAGLSFAEQALNRWFGRERPLRLTED